MNNYKIVIKKIYLFKSCKVVIFNLNCRLVLIKFIFKDVVLKFEIIYV